MKGGKIALSTVQEMYLQDSRFPNENVPQYIQLLEQFEIALKVELDRKLFIPSHLHANPGMDLSFMAVMVSECPASISLLLFLMVCGVGCSLGSCVGLNFLPMIGSSGPL